MLNSILKKKLKNNSAILFICYKITLNNNSPCLSLHLKKPLLCFKDFTMGITAL